MKKPVQIALMAVTMVLIASFCSQPLVILVHAESSSDDWPTFNHDSAHTGYSSSEAPLTNQTLWNFTTGGAVESSPVVANGIVYVGSDDGYIYALDASTGTKVWSYNTYGPVQSAATVLNGVVYVGGFHSHAVFALNASSGALIWNSPTISVYPNEISSTSVENGLVYVCVRNGGYGGGLRVLNATTGDLVWTYAPKALVYSSPAVYDGIVYFGSDSGYMFALDAVSGNLIWSCGILQNGTSSNSASQPIDCSVSVGDGLVYLGTAAQTVLALNASTGAFVWSSKVKGYIAFTTVVDANGTVYVSSTIGGTQNELNYGGISALNAKSGKLLWTDTLGSVEHSSPAVANGVIFVGSDNATASGPNFMLNTIGGIFYALNATTGATIWKYTTGGPVFSSPAIANGVVFVGSNDGNVYAFGSAVSQPSPSPTQTPSPTASQSPSSSPTPTQSPTISPVPSVPEFPSWFALPLAIVMVLTVVFARRENRKHRFTPRFRMH